MMENSRDFYLGDFYMLMLFFLQLVTDLKTNFFIYNLFKIT